MPVLASAGSIAGGLRALSLLMGAFLIFTTPSHGSTIRGRRNSHSASIN